MTRNKSEQVSYYGALEELLATPVFKDILRESIDVEPPRHRAAHVERILFRDIDAMLNLASSIPSLFNRLVYVLTEVGAQLSDKSTPALTTSVLESFVDDVDTDAVRRCWEVWSTQTADVLDRSPETREKLEGAAVALLSHCIATVINELCRHVAYPKTTSFSSKLIAETRKRIDWVSLESAWLHAADSLLDGQLDLFNRARRLVRHRLSRRESER